MVSCAMLLTLASFHSLTKNHFCVCVNSTASVEVDVLVTRALIVGKRTLAGHPTIAPTSCSRYASPFSLSLSPSLPLAFPGTYM